MTDTPGDADSESVQQNNNESELKTVSRHPVKGPGLDRGSVAAPRHPVPRQNRRELRAPQPDTPRRNMPASRLKRAGKPRNGGCVNPLWLHSAARHEESEATEFANPLCEPIITSLQTRDGHTHKPQAQFCLFHTQADTSSRKPVGELCIHEPQLQTRATSGRMPLMRWAAAWRDRGEAWRDDGGRRGGRRRPPRRLRRRRCAPGPLPAQGGRGATERARQRPMRDPGSPASSHKSVCEGLPSLPQARTRAPPPLPRSLASGTPPCALGGYLSRWKYAKATL